MTGAEIVALIDKLRKPVEWRTIDGVDVMGHPDGALDDLLKETVEAFDTLVSFPAGLLRWQANGVAIFTWTEKLEAVDRELAYRRRVYGRRVADGKMTQALADKQIALFESIRLDYATLAASERLL